MPAPLFTRFLLAGFTALCLLLGSALPAWAEFSLPPLPYAVDALEPAIDATTMTIHHDRHHGAYVANLNGQIQANPSLADLNLTDLQAKISQYPLAVRNNGGGHWNHSLFWTLLAPAGQGGSPSQDLIAAIDRDFGSIEAMRTQFEQAATTRFGSGWAWLIRRPDGSLAITSTANQDNPLMDIPGIERGVPLLALDVWEHAYYLKYQNRRPDYIQAWWPLVNWQEVNHRYAIATSGR